MKDLKMKVVSNRRIAENIFDLILDGPEELRLEPGSFVNLQLPGFFLRRPLSVCDLDGNRLRLIYKKVGDGTDRMTCLQEGMSLSVLVGLGRGFRVEAASGRPILVGGGVGIPPLYYLAKKLVNLGIKPDVLLGFNKEADLILQKEFEDLGCPVTVYSVDGSVGKKGLVTQDLDRLTGQEPAPYFFSCGPLPMLRALYRSMEERGWTGQLSLEERMGCGFGACMGCSIETKSGPKRVCKEGPVFDKEDLLW